MYTMDQLVVTYPESVPLNSNILNKRPTIINSAMKNNMKPPKR
jgi:hypothetical protein